MSTTSMREILLVEDNTLLRETLQSVLEAAAFRVIACHDGESAIEQARDRDIDVLLVDFRMPGLNGVDVTKIVRERHPSACIIGMSLENREKNFLAAGADAFLMKPFDTEELIRITGAKADELEYICLRNCN